MDDRIVHLSDSFGEVSRKLQPSSGGSLEIPTPLQANVSYKDLALKDSKTVRDK